MSTNPTAPRRLSAYASVRPSALAVTISATVSSTSLRSQLVFWQTTNVAMRSNSGPELPPVPSASFDAINGATKAATSAARNARPVLRMSPSRDERTDGCSCPGGSTFRPTDGLALDGEGLYRAREAAP